MIASPEGLGVVPGKKETHSNKLCLSIFFVFLTFTIGTSTKVEHPNKMEDFLSSENLCGQNLLRITARGSAIIAELLRLSDNIPDVFLYHPTNNNNNDKSNVKDNNEISKYLPVLFDFQYLREPEEYEKVSMND